MAKRRNKHVGSSFDEFLRTEGLYEEVTTLACGFNRSMQHTRSAQEGRSVADELPDRNYYTDSQKALMWERWKAGWTLHQIGHLFDRPHTSIQTAFCRGRVAFDRRATPFPGGAVFGRKRRDLARAGDRRIDSLNRCTARSSAIDRQPRTEAQRRPRGLSSHSGRQRRLGSGTST